MSNITMNENQNLLAFSEAVRKQSKAKRIKAFFVLELITLILSFVSLSVAIASLVVSINTYNSRYDATAVSSGGLTFTFSANGKDSGAGSFTASAGTITYGYFQESGSTPTQYRLNYKLSTETTYTTLKTFTVYSNNSYAGAFTLATSKYSARYDIQCIKLSNKTTKSVLEFDWGIE